MALLVTDNKVFGDGNGVATVFSFNPVRINAERDLIVFLVDPDGNEGDPLVLDVDYSTTPVGGEYPDTGSVTYPLVGDPLPTGWQIGMLRETEQTQETVLENQGGYNPKVQENTFDISRMIDQDQEERIGRSVKMKVSTDPSFETEIAAIPDTVIGINAAGNSFENYSQADFKGDPGEKGDKGDPGDGLTQVSADDTAPGFHEDKVVGSGLVVLSTLNPGANEQRQIDVPQSSIETIVDDRALLQDRHSYDLPVAAWVSPDDAMSVEKTGTPYNRNYAAFDPAVQTELQYEFPLPKSTALNQIIRGVIIYEEEAGATAHDVVWRVSQTSTDPDGGAEPLAWETTVDVTHTGVATKVNYVPFNLTMTQTMLRESVLFLRLENLVGDAGYTLDTNANFRHMRVDLVIDQGNDGDAT